MTWVVNRVRTVESVDTNKVEAIIDHLHQIKFLNKDKIEKETSGMDDEYTTTYFLPGSKIFEYIVLKGPDDEMYYADIPEGGIKDYESFCKVEVNYTDDFEGNNIIAITHCGDAFKDYSAIITELEKLTGDKYIAEEQRC